MRQEDHGRGDARVPDKCWNDPVRVTGNKSDSSVQDATEEREFRTKSFEG